MKAMTENDFVKSDLQRRVHRLRALIQNPDDTTPEQHARKSSDTSIAGDPSRRDLSEKSRWNRAKICTLGEIQGCFLFHRKDLVILTCERELLSYEIKNAPLRMRTRAKRRYR